LKILLFINVGFSWSISAHKHSNILTIVSSERNRYSDWLRTARQRPGVRVLVRRENFFLSTTPRLIVGPTHHPIHWILEADFRVWSSLGLNLSTHLQLVARSKIHGCIHPFTHWLNGVVLSYLRAGTNLPYLQMTTYDITFQHLIGVRDKFPHTSSAHWRLITNPSAPFTAFNDVPISMLIHSTTQPLCHINAVWIAAAVCHTCKTSFTSFRPLASFMSFIS
jgi:hypothetical protein